MNKYLIIGSAPSAKLIEPYINKLNDYYGAVFPINNAWYIVRDIKYWWSVSTDFLVYGTHIPEASLPTIDDYFNYFEDPHFIYDPGNLIPYGTMYLNTLYKIILNSTEETEIHVIGSDFDHSNDQTHFYGMGKASTEVETMLSNNEPQLVGKAADPLRSGTKALKTLLNNPIPDHIKIYTLSPNPNQLLPYPYLDIKDIFDE